MPVPKPSIVQKPVAAGNFELGRSAPISRITFHHIAGDANGAISRFQSASGVSSQYVIGSDGQIYQCVSENDTAYCDGSYNSNSRTISIEHAGGHASVNYTNEMYAASARLVAYLINKYNITDFKRHNEVVDKRYYPGGTACPGTLNVESIIDTARQIIAEANRPVPTPAPQIPAPILELTDIPNKKMVVTKEGGANLWDLRFNSYPEAKAIKHFNKGDIIEDISAQAVHPLGATYFVSEYSFRAGIYSGFNQVDVADYANPPLPTPAPVNETPAEPNRYTAFDKPMELLTKAQPTSVWGLGFTAWAEAKANVLLPAEFPFTAVGKYSHPLGSAYFMDADSFGDAAKTGQPNAAQGVNSIDLKLKPAPDAEAVPLPVQEAKPVPESANDDTVTVKVIVAGPDAWKNTFKVNKAGEYGVKTATRIVDLANDEAPELTLTTIKSDGNFRKIDILGTFFKDNVEYYKPKLKSYGALQEHWYGIPLICLDEGDYDSDDDLLSLDIVNEAKEFFGHISNRTKAVKKVAAIQKIAIADAHRINFMNRFKKTTKE